MKIYAILILFFLSINSRAVLPDGNVTHSVQAEKDAISTCSLICAYYDGEVNYTSVNSIGTSKEVAAKKLINICKSKSQVGGALVTLTERPSSPKLPLEYRIYVSDSAGITDYRALQGLGKELTKDEVDTLSKYIAKNYCDSLY